MLCSCTAESSVCVPVVSTFHLGPERGNQHHHAFFHFSFFFLFFSFGVLSVPYEFIKGNYARHAAEPAMSDFSGERRTPAYSNIHDLLD